MAALPHVKALALAAALVPCLAHAGEPLIDRPLVLPAAHVEVQLLGNLSDWSLPDGTSTGGQVGAISVELGDGEQQFGVALGLPVSPELAFGSIVGSLSQSLTRQVAVRVDIAFDHGKSHDQTPDLNVYTLGAGLPFKVRLTRDLALIGGRTGALEFAHFTNLDAAGGANNYQGAAANPFSSSDLIVFSKMEERPSQIALNAPIGLLWQPLEPLAITLRAGYELLFSPSDSVGTRHYLPLGLEAVVSPLKLLDIGASFSVAGQVFTTGGAASADYTGQRMATFWLRFRG